MAPTGSLYLPELPKLFEGEATIISWNDIPLHTLYRTDCPATEISHWGDRLRSFFDLGLTTLLSQDSPSFSGPSTASRKEFDLRTAPINAPPSAAKHHDITQLRNDATWLSKSLDLNEEEALKIVLLEWQIRPQLKLQAGYSEAEIASLKEVYASQLAFNTQVQAATFQSRNDIDFETNSSRRQRQIIIYFKECIGCTRTCLALADENLSKRLGVTARKPPSLTAVLELAVSQVDKFFQGSDKIVEGDNSEDMAYLLQVGQLFYISEILQTVILAATNQDQSTSPEIIRKWYGCMADAQFFKGVEPSALMPQEELRRLQSLVSFVSIALLQPVRTIDQMENSWLLDDKAVSEVQQILLNATDERCIQAIPIAFVWSLMLQDVRERGINAKDRRDSPIIHRTMDISSYDSATGRRSSIPGSTQQSMYEDVIDVVLSVSGLPDPITAVIQHTTEVFQVANLITAMYKISQGSPYIQRVKSQLVQEIILVTLSTLPDAYGPTVLDPQFVVLQPDQVDVEACNTFLQHPQLLDSLFENAAARFPYESYPFLKMCRILACADGKDKFNQAGDQYITFRLKSLKSFTNLAVGEFEKYHTIHEDENANLVELDQHTYAFPREVGLLTQSRDQSTVLVIPADTEGEVISNSSPPVIKWKYEYSGLHLIGEWLQLYYNGVLGEVLSAYEDPIAIASELILLLTNMLLTTNDSKSSNRDAAVSILEEVSSTLYFGTNIVDVIFSIMEQEIQAAKRKPLSESDLSVLPSTMSFARAILKIQPEQYWRLIAKTSVTSERSLLSTVIAGIESISGDGSLTTTVSQLYSETIAASLKRPLLERSAIYKNNEKVYENVVMGLTQNMLDIYELINQWTIPGKDKATVISILSEGFAIVIRSRYRASSGSSRLTVCLKAAAELILNNLRPESVGDAKTGPLLTHLLGAAQLNESFVSLDVADTCLDSLLRLSNDLVDTAMYLGLPVSGLEHCLLDIVPVLARLLQLTIPPRTSLLSSDPFSASSLTRTLLMSLATTKPTSLLGHLGSDSSICTLNVLMNSPSSYSFEVEAWTLLSHLISRDQQWLSVVILTGSIPDQKEQRRSDNEEIVYRGKPLITKALDSLKEIETLPFDLAYAILQFMITAQQNWSWALTTLRSRTDVFSSLVQFASKSESESATMHNHLRALITDLCSVHLQYAKSIRDKRMADAIAPLVEWLTLNVIDINSYNTSLHTNLSRNFADKFGISLEEFRNRPSDLPDTTYYNTGLADLVLASNSAWKPSSIPGRQSQSYASELDRANDNLSLVNSELALLSSFQSLLLEHASFFAEVDTLKKTLAHIAHRCLVANGQTSKKTVVQLQIFDDLIQSRAETALHLMRQLLRVKTTGSEVRELLKPAWESTLFGNSSYQTAMVNNDLVSWRTSLSVVLLALQFHIGKSKTPWTPRASTAGKPSQSTSASELLKRTTNIHPQIIEIARIVIGHGLETIVSTILEERQAELQRPPLARTVKTATVDAVGIPDLRMILNFLTSILRHPQLPDFQAQLAQILVNTGTVQSALRLYSFSHLLASEETSHDPVHGELALRLLVSLSSLSECAEELAIEGVLSQLLTARVTIALQQILEGVSNLDTRQHCTCLYLIWSQGILPLVLNLLNAVGAPIASEVSNFLNAFPRQLSKLATAFQPRHESKQGFITLPLAKEASTMSLISYILEDYRNAGASAAVDPSSILELKGFDEQRAGLISDLREHIALEKNILRGKIVATTVVEEGAGMALIDQVTGEMKSALLCLTKGEQDA